MSDSMTRIIQNRLAKDRTAFAVLGVPAPALNRLAAHVGKFCPGQPFDGKRMANKECFSNATTHGVQHKLHYVEGLAVRKGLPLLMHHAWCVDPDQPSRPIDPTWKDPDLCEYAEIIRLPAYLAFRRMAEGAQVYGLLDVGCGLNTEYLTRYHPDLMQALEQREDAA